MEQHTDVSLFNLSIDNTAKAHLNETARWARFLSIAGFIFLGLIIIAGIVFTMFLSKTMSGMTDSEYGGIGAIAGMGVGMAFFYILIAAVWFFPILYLYRFSNSLRKAVVSDDQQALNIAFQNLKICLRYVGIVTIIILAIYAIAIVVGVAGAAMFS
jgi:hypothetical protein